MARVGFYANKEFLTLARAAFITDWTNGGPCDTFTAWVDAAIHAWAALTPEQRAHRTPSDHPDSHDGPPRSFPITTETRAALETALAADRRNGYWHTISSWTRAAITEAINTARTRNNGTLDEPPPRLPPRMIR